MIVAGSANPLLLGQSQGYNLTKSLRFRSSASAYLNRTYSSSGNLRLWTLSWWTKRGQLSTAAQTTMFGTDYASNQECQMQFTAGNKFVFEQYTAAGATFLGNLISTQVFRDPSAWYHIVVTWDSAQATASNRIKVYVNGTQITAWDTASYPAQNADSVWNNNTNAHYIGRYSTAKFYDGYQTEINFIDGQALTPSSFGQTSSTTGVWQPIKYTGTYGTNGFYLPFTNTTSTSTLGNDFSGNNNTWTVNNISLTSGSTYDSMNDVPTLTSATAANYCVLNPIIPIPRGTISQGNLNYLSGSTSSHGSVAATFTLPTTGKWYWEVTACNNSGGSGNNEVIGVANILNNPQLPAAGSEIGSGSRGDYAYRSDGNKYSNGNQGAYGATYTNGDVIGVAWDSDSGTITFYKNNVSQGTAFSSITQVAGKFAPASSNAETSNGDNYNFGQRPFSYTPPSGFNALNTFNLPTPTIGATASTVANKYMDATTYTGNGSALTVTNSGSMQPDLLWTKQRSGSAWHYLQDAVRGVNKALFSNATDAEYSIPSTTTTLNSNGFSFNGGESGLNVNGATYVAWQWKANGSGSTNTAGSITSTVSANTTAGFSIVTFSTTAVSTQTWGHGLGVAPRMVIVKSRGSVDNWYVYHASLGNASQIQLNSTAASAATNLWNSTTPSSTIVTFGAGFASAANYVAYCFAEIAGYSAFGSYTGNGSTDGTFVYTGFRPRYVMFKRTDVANDWVILDTARNTFNVMTSSLFPNSASAETSNGFYDSDMLSNGIKIRSANAVVNANGGTYIYMAFAESPFKYANAR